MFLLLCWKMLNEQCEELESFRLRNGNIRENVKK